MTKRSTDELTLKGLAFAPSQCFGGIRLVPILRSGKASGLRISKRSYQQGGRQVALNASGRSRYHSYIPHGFIISWDEKGLPVSAYGTNLSVYGKQFGESTGLVHRMAKRKAGKHLRVLPLHLAMEGFLSLQFGGPPIAWAEYSSAALKLGLSPRTESSFSGRWITGLEEALRIFEIHETQVGVACFVADALASVFVVSHSDDYRLLHLSILEDFFGDLLYQYGLLYNSVQEDVGLLELDGSSFASLRAGLSQLREQVAGVSKQMLDGLCSRPISSEKIYQAGPYQLKRFMTDLSLQGENHIGEMIQNEAGEMEYLKTFRLSTAQTKRAYLLRSLAEHQWNIADTAKFFGQSPEAWMLRMHNAGFGYLLKDHVLLQAQAAGGRLR